ncbi:MAG: tyrosine-type recombinase/integrase [Acidobacteriota bacterium]
MRGSDSLSIKELNALTEACGGNLGIRDKTLIELFAATGLRVSEIATLKVPQVVVASKALDFLHLEAEHTKRKRGGKLPLNERVKAMLEIYVVWLRTWYQGEWLFPGYDDKHITSRAIQKIIKRLKRDAGLTKKVTPHSLRKHFINRLLDDKTDIRVVRSLSRHANLESLHAYVEENEGEAVAAVERLGKR